MSINKEICFMWMWKKTARVKASTSREWVYQEGLPVITEIVHSQWTQRKQTMATMYIWKIITSLYCQRTPHLTQIQVKLKFKWQARATNISNLRFCLVIRPYWKKMISIQKIFLKVTHIKSWVMARFPVLVHKVRIKLNMFIWCQT